MNAIQLSDEIDIADSALLPLFERVSPGRGGLEGNKHYTPLFLPILSIAPLNLRLGTFQSPSPQPLTRAEENEGMATQALRHGPAL
jgi:hypothetical protein